VDTETFDLTKRSRDTTTRKSPENSVHGFRELGKEIIGSFVSSTSLRSLSIRLRLTSMNEIRELDGIMHKEGRYVVTNKVKETFISVETKSETMDITHSIRRATRTEDSRDTNKHGSFLSLFPQETGSSDVGVVAIGFKVAVQTNSTSVNSTLRDSFMIYANMLG